MAICRYFGKPDLFITFTCNPMWQEIQDALLPGQKPEDAPHIVARVFHLKLRALLDDLLKHNVLGKVVARDPSLCFFTSIQTNNPAITEPMQVDKSIVEVKDQKEPLQKRLGFENNRGAQCRLPSQSDPKLLESISFRS